VDESNGKCGLKPHGYWVAGGFVKRWLNWGIMVRWPIYRMRQRRLWDTYTFPRFSPPPTVRGVFGDPKAASSCLPGRAKKTACGCCGRVHWLVTTGVYGGFAICRCGDTRIFLEIEGSGGCECRSCGKVKQASGSISWADNPLYIRSALPINVGQRCRQATDQGHWRRS